MSEYIYLNSFKDKIKMFELKESVVMPIKQVTGKYVKYPDTAVFPPCKVTFCAELGESELILDFGTQIVGSICLQVTAFGNARLQFFYGENREECMRSKPYTCGWYELPQDTFALSDGSHELITYGRRAFRYVRMIVPFGSGRIRIESLHGLHRHYPVQYRGGFNCSDDQLNDIWRIASNTTKLCMQQYYEDGVKRDGLLWIGDFRTQFLCNAYAFGDIELARKCIYMIAKTQRADGALPACSSKSGAHQHPHNIEYMPGIPHDSVDKWIILGYNTDFICLILEYLQLTGDAGILVDVWPFVIRTMNYLINTIDFNEVKLVNKDTVVTILSDVGRDFEGNFSSSCTMLMQLYWAFSDGIRLAVVMGDEQSVKMCREYAEKLAQEINDNYYNRETKLYADYSLNNPNSIRHVGFHSQFLAILSGIVTVEDGNGLLTRALHFLNCPRPTVAFMRGWMNHALFETGLGEHAVSDIRKQWGLMVKSGYTTCWDRMDSLDFSPLTEPAANSYCHGWGGTPAYLLPMFVLGVRAVEPGFKRIIVQPKLGDLAWAEGCVPTPFGDIFVRWEANLGGIIGCIELPEGVTGDLIFHNNGTKRMIPLLEGINRI